MIDDRNRTSNIDHPSHPSIDVVDLKRRLPFSTEAKAPMQPPASDRVVALGPGYRARFERTRIYVIASNGQRFPIKTFRWIIMCVRGIVNQRQERAPRLRWERKASLVSELSSSLWFALRGPILDRNERRGSPVFCDNCAQRNRQ